MGGLLGGCSSLIASASAVMVGISMLLASFVAFGVLFLIQLKIC